MDKPYVVLDSRFRVAKDTNNKKKKTATQIDTDSKELPMLLDDGTTTASLYKDTNINIIQFIQIIYNRTSITTEKETGEK